MFEGKGLSVLSLLALWEGWRWALALLLCILYSWLFGSLCFIGARQFPECSQFQQPASPSPGEGCPEREEMLRT